MISQLLFLALFLAMIWSFSLASQSLQDFCVPQTTFFGAPNGNVCKDPSLAEANDFFYSGFNISGNTSTVLGSHVTTVEAKQIPGLNTFGISIARIDFAPWGVNPPHTHPRAAEILTVLEGRLQVGFVTSNPENKLITKTLEPGDVFVFPEGLVHFHDNVGYSAAVAYSAFSSQNPGTVTLANTLFGSRPHIASDILSKAFQVDRHTINSIQSRF